MNTSRKAIVGAIIAGLGSLAAATVDNSLTLGEGVAALAVAAVAYGGVYGVSNKPKE